MPKQIILTISDELFSLLTFPRIASEDGLSDEEVFTKRLSENWQNKLIGKAARDAQSAVIAPIAEAVRMSAERALQDKRAALLVHPAITVTISNVIESIEMNR